MSRAKVAVVAREEERNFEQDIIVGMRTWLKDLGGKPLNATNFNIRSYLHEEFQHIPFDRNALSEATEFIAQHFNEGKPHGLHFLAIRGEKGFGFEHFFYVMKVVFDPLMEYFDFNIAYYNMKAIAPKVPIPNVPNFSIAKFIQSIPVSTCILLLSDCDECVSIDLILSRLRREYPNLIIITAWPSSSWRLHRQGLKILFPKLKEITMNPLDRQQTRETLQIILKFVGLNSDVPNPIVDLMYEETHGHLQDIIDMVILTFKQAYAMKCTTIDYNAVFLAMIKHEDSDDDE